MSADHFLPDIILDVGASAERDTCGSCQFFRRRRNSTYDSMYGLCGLVLPKHYVRNLELPRPKNQDEEDWPNNTIQDTDRCDLWRSTGRTYIVSRKVGP